MSALLGAPALAAHVAACGLRTAQVATPAGDNEWRELLILVEKERLAGLLVRSIREGELAATPAQVDDAQVVHDRAMRWCLRLERELVRVVDGLSAGSVPTRVLKGVALAHLDYDDPSDRAFRDIDLLVPSELLDSAVHLLDSLGFAPTYSEPRRGFQSEFGKGRSTAAEGGVEVDVHRTLAMGPYALLIEEANLWEGEERFVIGGRTMAALGPAWRFLHACLHFVLSPNERLWIARDVAQLHSSSGFEATRVRSLAANQRLTAVLAGAISTADGILGTSGPLSEWAKEATPTAAERRLLRTYGPTAGEAERTMASLTVLRGVRPRLRLIRALSRPDAAFAQSRGVSRRGWALRAARRRIRRRDG